MSDNIRLARLECKASRAVFDAIAVKSLAPCGANRPNARLSSCRRHFNSLAPCGANPDRRLLRRCVCHFNSLAPCGANPNRALHSASQTHFNSLAPCGANPSESIFQSRLRHFNSLAPCGANRDLYFDRRRAHYISTHSPRAGRPSWNIRRMRLLQYFNSLAPCGANLIVKQKGLDTSEVHFFNARGKSPVTSTFIGTPSILGSHTRKSFPQRTQ